ncbi:MAG: NAD(P)/FAD-dependent oxidoreductase [Roseobacter sp.]
MKTVFPEHTYGPGPRKGCFWDETCTPVPGASVAKDTDVDVAIVGAGFTGLSAALSLAESGAKVAVLESKTVGWGASGRNGGFCCLGGGLAGDAELDRRFGRKERLIFRAAEKATVEHTATMLHRLGIDADTHSSGETMLAHRPRDAATLTASLSRIRENYGVDGVYLRPEELTQAGMSGPFYGALTVPIGFGLNPLKYLTGLHKACLSMGVQVFENSPVEAIQTQGKGHVLVSGQSRTTASKVVLATNGYTNDDLSSFVTNRVMPAQSTVLVTRPLTQEERLRQGWTTDQMCYDSRTLLHYFRLMPDQRFLFGMRGGLLGGIAGEARARKRLLQHFRRMFPEWRHVEITNSWSGLVGLARSKVPFVGRCSEESNIYASLCYHGNGVAMAGYAGRLVSDLITGDKSRIYPKAMQHPMRPFPLGSLRRLLMPPLYAGLKLRDL